MTALWATFTPCFLWIFAGAPYVEWINAQPRLRGALAAITAAVVGVILNLAIWFAIHVVFARVGEWRWSAVTIDLPDFSSIDFAALALVAAALLAVFRFKLGTFVTLALAALAGVAWSLATV